MKSCSIFIFTLLLFAACKKEDAPKTVTNTPSSPSASVNTDMQSGLPEKPLKIHGYFYAVMAGGNPNAFAAFSMSPKNLTVNYDHYSESNNVDTAGHTANLSDADAGPLTVNGRNMNLLNMVPETYNYLWADETFDVNGPITWSMPGKGFFPALTTTVKRGFPKIYPGPGFYYLSHGSDFTLSLDSISNYDSLIVFLQSDLTLIRKVIPTGNRSVTFTATELAPIQNPGIIAFYTYNYSNQTVNNRRYLFELSYKYLKNFVISP